jgi:hypothetical protein
MSEKPPTPHRHNPFSPYLSRTVDEVPENVALVLDAYEAQGYGREEAWVLMGGRARHAEPSAQEETDDGPDQ